MCIEMDLSLSLAPSIAMGKYDYFLEYEHMHLICFFSGRVGHLQENCFQLPESEKKVSDELGTVVNQKSTDKKIVTFNGHFFVSDKPEEIGYGAWMVVSKKKKQAHGHGSARFEAQNSMGHSHNKFKHLLNQGVAEVDWAGPSNTHNVHLHPNRSNQGKNTRPKGSNV